MKRSYKLAANFNTVEFEITYDDLLEVCDFETEIELDEDQIPTITVEYEVLIKRILQREYDLLASINVVNIAPPIKQSEPIKQAEKINPPSEKQAAFAESLGMKDAMKHDKNEVWAYIQKHKKI